MIANVRATARLAKMEARPKVATKDRIFGGSGGEPMVSPERSCEACGPPIHKALDVKQFWDS